MKKKIYKKLPKWTNNNNAWDTHQGEWTKFRFQMNNKRMRSEMSERKKKRKLKHVVEVMIFVFGYFFLSFLCETKCNKLPKHIHTTEPHNSFELRKTNSLFFSCCFVFFSVSSFVLLFEEWNCNRFAISENEMVSWQNNTLL